MKIDSIRILSFASQHEVCGFHETESAYLEELVELRLLTALDLNTYRITHKGLRYLQALAKVEVPEIEEEDLFKAFFAGQALESDPWNYTRNGAVVINALTVVLMRENKIRIHHSCLEYFLGHVFLGWKEKHILCKLDSDGYRLVSLVSGLTYSDEPIGTYLNSTYVGEPLS